MLVILGAHKIELSPALGSVFTEGESQQLALALSQFSMLECWTATDHLLHAADHNFIAQLLQQKWLLLTSHQREEPFLRQTITLTQLHKSSDHLAQVEHFSLVLRIKQG